MEGTQSRKKEVQLSLFVDDMISYIFMCMCVCVCVYTYRNSLSSYGKESAYNAGDPGLVPGLGRSSGEGKGNLLQYSCLGNPMDR